MRIISKDEYLARTGHCIAKKDESVLLIDNFFLRYSEKGVENALLQRK